MIYRGLKGISKTGQSSPRLILTEDQAEGHQGAKRLLRILKSSNKERVKNYPPDGNPDLHDNLKESRIINLNANARDSQEMKIRKALNID